MKTTALLGILCIGAAMAQTVQISNQGKSDYVIVVPENPAPVIQTYDTKLTVDIFDGPTIGFAPRKDGGFDLEFLPWHREWSHALTVGLFLGILWWLVSCCFGAFTVAWQGLVTIAGCYAVHVVEDQIGHMGSNLFYPFTKHRAPGLHWMHSGDGLPNFTAVWLSCLLIFWNLAQRTQDFSFWKLLLVALVIPYAVFGILRWLLNLGHRVEKMTGDDADDEWNEMKAS